MTQEQSIEQKFNYPIKIITYSGNMYNCFREIIYTNSKKIIVNGFKKDEFNEFRMRAHNFLGTYCAVVNNGKRVMQIYK